MTETEAKTKWCPMSRNLVQMGAAIASANQLPDKQFPACIASACMMWRWSKIPGRYDVKEIGDDAGLIEGDGYCGLAGKPC